MFPWILACRHEPEPWVPTPSTTTSPAPDPTSEPLPPGPAGWDTCAILRTASLWSSPGQEQWSLASTTEGGDTDLVGWFDGAVPMGEATLTPVGEDASVLARYAPDGSLRWARQLDGTIQAGLDALSPGPDGGVYAVGTADALSFFVPGEPLGGMGETDVFVARFGPEGELLWSGSFGSPEEDRPYDVLTWPDGGVMVGGTFSGTLALGETTLELPEESTSAAFLVRYSADGAVLWAQSIGGSESAAVTSLDYDPSQDVLLAQGYAAGESPITFGAGTPQEHSFVPGDTDTWLARFDGDGVFSWVAEVGDYTYGRGAALWPDGTALMAGSTYEDVVFERGEPGELRLSPGDGDLKWLASYEDGQLLWARSLTSDEYVEIKDLAILPSGEGVLLGYFRGSLVLGAGEPDAITLTSMSGLDGLLVTFDAQGQLGCALQLQAQVGGSTSYLVPEALALRSDGGLEIVGSLTGETWLGAQGEVRLSSLSKDGLRLVLDLL